MRGLALSLWLLMAAGAQAQQSPAEAARAAADQLSAATSALEQAGSARDRVRALTETVSAYEQGLEAMREGLRRVATREAQLSRQLAVRNDEIARLLGVLQAIGKAPPPVQMLHPDGPLGNARSGMILADVAPELNARAESLRADLQEVQTLRQLQNAAVGTLEQGLEGVQKARADLSKAVADRQDLPRRFTEDPVRTAILLSSTETLDGFASGLSQISEGQILGSNADISTLKGELPLPLQGIVLHRAGQADAAGIRRKGIVVAARPRAMVVSPTAATLRYLGPLLDLGNVVILEPQPGLLFVFSGLSEVFGRAGQVISSGTPVGLMGGADTESDAILSLSSDGAGNTRPETLYIEVREDSAPVDPELWFQTDKDG